MNKLWFLSLTMEQEFLNRLRKKCLLLILQLNHQEQGLGLSIVKRYVENASGRIWFESEPDKGSVFFVEFPHVKHR